MTRKARPRRSLRRGGEDLPKTIAILNQKGGSGKTTIATNLAHALQRMGHEVLLVTPIRRAAHVTGVKPARRESARS